MVIHRDLSHQNVVRVHHAYFTAGEYEGDSILNLVMDFIPSTV